MITKYEKANGVKLFALVAVLAMVFAGAAIVITDDGVEAANDNTQVYGGMTLTEDQTFKNVSIRVIDDLTVDGATLTVDGGNFTVDENITVTVINGGSIEVKDGLVTIDGKVTVTGDDGNTSTPTASKLSVNYTSSVDKIKYKDYGVIVNGTLEITRGGTMVGSGTSPSILVNNGGNLNVASSGSRISTINGLNVDVAVGGTFHFDGRAGTQEMTVTSYGSGNNQTTASAKIGAGDNTPAAGDNSTSDLTFTTTSTSYTAYSDNGKSSVLMREYALNVTGNVDGYNTITFVNNYTGDYYTSEDAAKATEFTYNDKVVGKVIIDALDVKVGAKIVVNEGAYVVVVNSLNVAYDADKSKAVNEILGTIELQGTFTGNLLTVNAAAMSEQKGTLAINGGKAELKNYNDSEYGGIVKILGAMWIDDDDDTTAHITDLATALKDAEAAGIDDVRVIGLNGFDSTSDGRGSYILSEDLIISDGMNLTVICGLVIDEGVSLTVPANASLGFDLTGAGIYVDGKLIDYDTLTTTQIDANIDFEVMSQVTTESDVINTYTTFATALSETTSGTIYLYDDVVIDRNMTIPENVTVQYADKTSGSISFKDDTNYTFTINGTVYLSTGHSLDVSGGTVVVNSILKSTDPVSTSIVGNTGDHMIEGAYFVASLGDDDTDYNYITSVAYAAENSASINTEAGENVIYIAGNVAMGDVTFTLGEDVAGLEIAIFNSGNDKATGNITLVGGVMFNTADGKFDGTINADVSAGNVTIDFDNVMDAVVSVVSKETAEGTETSVQLYSYKESDDSYNQIDGIVTISSGEVTVPTYTLVDKIVVSNGSTLNVNAYLGAVTNPNYKFNTTSSSLPLFTESLISSTAGLVVDGTVVIDIEDGTTALEAFIAYVTGTVTVKSGAFEAYISCIDGTVAAEDGASVELSQSKVNGTVSGDVSFEYVLAMPGSDLTGADITAPNNADIQTTNVYANGNEFTTIYAADGKAVEAVLLYLDIGGVQIDTAKFCTDESMNNVISDVATESGKAVYQQINSVVTAFRGLSNSASITTLQNAINGIEGTDVGTYSDIYISMDAATVAGKISSVQGLTIYIDGLGLNNYSIGNGNYSLTVGEHEITVQVTHGYTATPVITFNGQTVTDGKITITGDMKDFTLLASGEVSIDAGSSGSSDDGMGIVEILLIILVVVVVILAIFVVLRMMRS